jgi:hypothetical protein
MPPAIGEQLWMLEKLVAARYIGKSIVHALGMSNHLRKVVMVVWILQGALGDCFAARIENWFIVVAYHMQNHIVVRRIGMVMMSSPVGCSHMYFDIPYPFLLPDAQVCMAKVGTCIAVVLTYR